MPSTLLAGLDFIVAFDTVGGEAGVLASRAVGGKANLLASRVIFCCLICLCVRVCACVCVRARAASTVSEFSDVRVRARINAKWARLCARARQRRVAVIHEALTHTHEPRSAGTSSVLAGQATC